MKTKEKIILRASQAMRYDLCPASYRMELGLPDTKSEAAQEGTMLHACMAGHEPPVPLTDEQMACLTFCRTELEALIARVLPGNSVIREHQEKEIINETLGWSGHPDFLAIRDGKILCIDWKFGREPVAPAEANLQGRVYLVLETYDMDNLQEAYFAIVQPRAPQDKRVTICAYSPDDLVEAEKQLKSIRRKVRSRSKPTPGDKQCQYCRAKASCSALKQEIELAVATPLAITNGNAAEIYAKCQLAKKWLSATVDAVEEHVIKSGGKVPGLTFKDGKERRTIEDPTKAFSTLEPALPEKDFIEACSVSLPKLVKAYQKNTDMPYKLANDTVEGLLRQAGCLTVKQDKPSLELEEHND